MRHNSSGPAAGLTFLSALDVETRSALVDLGSDEFDGAGTVLIEAGNVVTEVSIITEGVADVLDGDGTVISTLGPGEIIGELAFITGQQASATVTCRERVESIRLGHKTLEKFAAGPHGASLWRALAVSSATRVGSRRSGAPVADSTSPFAGVDELASILEQLDSGEDVPQDEVDAAFGVFVAQVDRFVRESGADHPAFVKLRELVVPFTSKSKLMNRVWSKPHGYSGDWLTLEHVYANVPEGDGPVGRALDAAVLGCPGPTSIRNRRPLFAELLSDLSSSSPIRATALACGPAREVTDVLTHNPYAFSELNLLDIDSTAIDYVSKKLEDMNVDVAVLHESNLIKLALGREQLHLADQDIVYSIGLIDYFPDELVIALLDLVHPWLKPGGRVVLGNIHERSPVMGLMELLEWSIVHRTEDDMNRIFEASAFGRPCQDILWESEGVNMFAVGIRAEE